MSDDVRDVESPDINSHVHKYIENVAISVMKDFFMFYPPCSPYQWVGDPKGKVIDDESKINIVDEYPETLEGHKKPVVVISVSGNPIPGGLGSGMDALGDEYLEENPENEGMTVVKGYLFQGEIHFSVVSLSKIATKDIASLIINHQTQVLWKRFGDVKIQTARNITNYDYRGDNWLSGKNIYHATFDLNYLVEIRERVPIYYENYIFGADFDGDGEDEYYMVEDNEDPDWKRDSVRKFDEENYWEEVSDALASKVLAEFNRLKKEGLLTPATSTYIKFAEEFLDDEE